MKVFNVIIAGGRGTRFWPLTKRTPKQFLKIFKGKSLLSMTVERFLPMDPSLENTFIVTSRDMVGNVKEDIPWFPEKNIIVEPFGRNTAPAICLSAFFIKERFGSGIMGVFPSDHFIEGERFRELYNVSIEIAAEYDLLGTFGIKPRYPETGYGYIEKGEEIRKGVYRVKEFHEKPGIERATFYVNSGRFYWNSGMFVWKVDVILEEMKNLAPSIYTPFEGLKGDFSVEALENIYKDIPSISVDYAVMEKTKRVFVVEADFYWSDVGSWRSYYELMEKDKKNNVVDGNVKIIDSEGCLIKGYGGKMVAVIGLRDIAIVDTEDALLVVSLDRSQDVKKVVEG